MSINYKFWTIAVLLSLLLAIPLSIYREQIFDNETREVKRPHITTSKEVGLVDLILHSKKAYASSVFKVKEKEQPKPPPVAVVQPTPPAPKPQPKPQPKPVPRPAQKPVQPVSISEAQAKAFIYQKESGNNPAAVNSIGCKGIGQACPGSKIAHCGIDYACQDAWFTGYMQNRYGSWANAYAFWIRNHWW